MAKQAHGGAWGRNIPFEKVCLRLLRYISFCPFFFLTFFPVGEPPSASARLCYFYFKLPFKGPLCYIHDPPEFSSKTWRNRREKAPRPRQYYTILSQQGQWDKTDRQPAMAC